MTDDLDQSLRRLSDVTDDPRLDALAPGDGQAWLDLYAAWDAVGDDLVAALLTPFPPVRFTTLTGCPSSFSRSEPMMRAVASVPPPAAQGTMRVTGRSGQPAAVAGAAPRKGSAARSEMADRSPETCRRSILVPP